MPTLKWIALMCLAPAAFLSAALPVMAAPDKIMNVSQSGVVADGVTLDTITIQKAVDECSATGGGAIDFPAGRYLTGTIQLKSNVTLRLEDGATILGSTNPADYRNLDPFTDGKGNPMGFALIVATDADHVGIEGSGTIDGQGPTLKTHEHPFTMRPFLIRWVRCSHVTVRDVHLTNPGAWTMHFSQTKGALVDGVTIRTRETKLVNNDGIDIDSSEDVQVRNCDIDSEDDAIVIKSTSAAPSRKIVASGCKLSSHTNAIKLGTESFGGFEDISISNCHVLNTEMSGIALYQVDGGDLRHVTISDVTMDGVTLPISIRLGSRLKTFRTDQTPKTAAGTLSDITIKNVTAKNIKMVGMLINGVPGHPIHSLILENIHLELPGGGTPQAAQVKLAEKEATYPEFNMFGKTIPAYGIYARHVDGITLTNVQTSVLKPDARPAAVFIDVQDVKPADFAAASSQPSK